MCSNVSRLKQGIDLDDHNNVVYAISCGDCGIRYFGRQCSIFVIEEANIREMLEMERQHMVSIVT